MNCEVCGAALLDPHLITFYLPASSARLGCCLPGRCRSALEPLVYAAWNDYYDPEQAGETVPDYVEQVLSRLRGGRLAAA